MGKRSLPVGLASTAPACVHLPNATQTRIIVTMNARELLHFFGLRCCLRAQWEIREVAERMLGLVRRAAPTIFAGGWRFNPYNNDADNWETPWVITALMKAGLQPTESHVKAGLDFIKGVFEFVCRRCSVIFID